MNTLLTIYVLGLLFTYFTSPPDGESSGFSMAFNIFTAVIWPLYWVAVISVGVYWIVSKPKHKRTLPPPSGLKRDQGGYYSMDIGGLFIFLIVAGIAIGVVVSWGLPYVWAFIKPIIHSLTA